MRAQGTYLDSVCPYECGAHRTRHSNLDSARAHARTRARAHAPLEPRQRTRAAAERGITRHAVSSRNALNLLSGAGLQGERFLYPGVADDAAGGFSRFASVASSSTSSSSSLLLHALRMLRNVTIDQCSAVVRSHRLLAPHAVWLIDPALVDEPIDALRKGECGLFLGARAPLQAQLWRAFYRYARLVLRLGHVDQFVDDDIREAFAHTAVEGDCLAGSSAVCVWWSEFALDDEEYRPADRARVHARACAHPLSRMCVCARARDCSLALLRTRARA